jgi:FkbM family methyltransferase
MRLPNFQSINALNRLAFNRFGLHVTRAAKSSDVTRTQLIRAAGVEEVLDIGAHVGRYGQDLRRDGFRGRIISVEPNPKPFARLSRLANSDGRWLALQAAVATGPGSMDLHISSNEVSSSLLPMNDLHVQAAPQSAISGILQVQTISADSILINHHLLRPLLMKIDVQGAESTVLDGATELLGLNGPVRAIEIELSAAPLYANQVLYRELLERLERVGFQLWALNPGLVAADGQLLQFDAQLIRR